MSTDTTVRYLELTGAQTTDTDFEPQLYKVRDLFGKSRANLRSGNTDYTIRAFSTSDIEFIASAEAVQAFKLGARMFAEISVGDETLYRGSIKLRRISEYSDEFKVLARLMDDGLDLDACRTVGVEVANAAGPSSQDLSDELLPSRYVEACGRFVYALRLLRREIRDLEARCLPEAELSAQIARLEKSILSQFIDLAVVGNEIAGNLRRIDPRFASMKAYTEAVIYPEIEVGQSFRRAFEKPLGYPGDFQVMEYAYARRSRSGDRYNDVVDHLMSDYIGACVRLRMQAAVDKMMTDFVARGPGSEPLKMASIGAGPARELELILSAPLQRPLEITLVEQDARALETVFTRAYGKLARHKPTVDLRTLHASLIDLLRSGRLYSGFEAQDAIYSLGLIDYFNQPTAKRVARGFYEKLRPGGTLILCNMRDYDESAYWPLEFLCDWRLEYRTEADMRDLAEGLESAKVEVVPEPSGKVWMLYITKPA